MIVRVGHQHIVANIKLKIEILSLSDWELGWWVYQWWLFRSNKYVANIANLAPTHFVSNIRYQHRYDPLAPTLKFQYVNFERINLV